MWFCVVNSTPPRFLMQPKFCIISLQTFCTSFRCTALTATSSFRSSASFFSARAALATASSSVFCCSLQIKIVDHNDEWLPINWIAHHTHTVFTDNDQWHDIEIAIDQCSLTSWRCHLKYPTFHMWPVCHLTGQNARAASLETGHACYWSILLVSMTHSYIFQHWAFKVE